jgi:hypothetical protein
MVMAEMIKGKAIMAEAMTAAAAMKADPKYHSSHK